MKNKIPPADSPLYASWFEAEIVANARRLNVFTIVIRKTSNAATIADRKSVAARQ